MFQKNCAVWFTLLAWGFYMHSVNGSNQTRQTAACSTFGTCSQICTTHAEAINCSCADGFKLKENGWGCDPLDASWKIFYSTYNYRYWVLSMWDSETKKTTNYTISKMDDGWFKICVHHDFKYITVRLSILALRITYDARNNAIYTAGRKDGIFSVVRTSLRNGSSVELFQGMTSSQHLAFDWTTGNIYFADDNYFRIFVCKNNSNVCAVLIDETVNQPKHIALHPASGLLFWTEQTTTSGIMRAGMDGSQPLQIISFNSSWPRDLTVDQANERIYFAVGFGAAIQSSRFDGSDQKIVISSEIAGHANDFNVFGDRMIWYDSKSKKIKSAEKFSGSNKQVIMSNVEFIYGLVVFHVANQPVSGTSPCVEANCSHICTIGPQETFKCFCPVGMKLAEDRNTCAETDDTPKLVVASKGAFKTRIIGSIEKAEWEVTHLDTEIKSIADIVYNPVNHTLILSDSVSKRIYEYSLSSKKLSVLVDGNLDTVQSLDIDVVGENLYWADSGKNTIEVISLRTRATGVIWRNLLNIRDVVVVQETRVDDVPEGYYKWVFKCGLDANSANGYTWGIEHGPPSDIINFGNLVYYVYGLSIYEFSMQTGRARILSQMQLGSFDPNSRLRHNDIDAKMTIIDRNLSSLEDLLTRHDCGIKNPKTLNCSHLCLLTGEKFVGICSCPEGMLLGEDKLTCTSLPTCSHFEFTCGSTNECIPKAYICDGESDCEDGEDESNCQETTCTPAYFKCATSGKCIPGDWVCDEEPDCVGGDDEFNCTRSCNADEEFTCENTNKCIPKSSRCDGVVDCLEDNSDERDCEVTSCADYQLQCRSGLCIENELLCNGIPNCDDAEDEVNCSGVVVEPTGKEIATSAVHNNNGTEFVVVIAVLFTLILMTLPLGVIIR